MNNRETPEGFVFGGVNINSDNNERKNIRLQLVLRASTKERAKRKADLLGISLNEYIHQLIESDT